MSARAGLTALAIRRPVGTMALASVVVVLGLFFQGRLAVDLLPAMAYPEIVVTVNYPGAAPEVMEQQITRVLESSLSATENLSRIASRASEGRTNVNLIFDYGTDIDLALQDAARNLELARTQLPPDIMPPRLYKRDPTAEPVYELGFTSDTRSELEVRDWLEFELAPQLRTTPGVGGIEVAGGRVREFQVRIDQERLAHHGLPVSAVREALIGENVEVAAGWVTGESFAVMATTDTRLRTSEDIARVAIALPGTGQTVRLDEIAEVLDTHREQRIFVRLDGRPATRLSVFKLPDANTLEVVDGVAATLARLQESGFVPPDIAVTATTDQRFFIRSSIRAVASAAMLGGGLATLVVLLFLGSVRKALVIGLSIPLSILATFAMMSVGGLTLNVMTLGGLALGVGVLLDNAIVMLENIARHRDSLEKEEVEAALDGAGEVRSAVVAATVTNLAAVVPFLLITGLAAMLFRELILTISLAIVVSLAVALTVVPSLAAVLGRVRFSSRIGRSPPLRLFQWAVRVATDAYAAAARLVFRGRLLVLLLAAVAVWLSWEAVDGLGSEFLPQVDDGQVSAVLVLPPGAPPEVTLEHALRMEEVLEGTPSVEHLFGLVGGHLGGGILNERPGTARYSVSLGPAGERPELSAGEWVRQAQEALRAMEIPGARYNVRPPRLPGLRLSDTGAAISIGVVGDDLEELDRIGRDLLLELGGIAGLTELELARDDRSPLLRVDVDRERAAALGLSPREIAQAARVAVGGDVATRVATGTAEVDVRVALPPAERRDTEDLANLLIVRHGEAPVRLGDVARFRLTDGPAHIERENQTRILRLSGEVNTVETDVGTVNRAIRDRVADLALPDGYRLIFGGEEEVIRETNRALFTVILLALFLVFVVLAVQYERLSSPLVILSSAPLALVGVVGILVLTQTPTSAPVLLGVVLLVGIVVNNAILLVEMIERGVAEGRAPLDAAVEAGRVRFRPILMTSFTTICGMLPLALGMGEGADLMRPLALAVVGGLLVSMGLTLFVVPSFWLLVHPVATGLKRLLTGRTDAQAEAPGQTPA
ncbi:MAG: efflux RND transporter permease subunit [Deltaproteobacteria bacterium]|nr:MAG: efflux RND transporter permease subunit [Deltaproteobacteria bacterium]